MAANLELIINAKDQASGVLRGIDKTAGSMQKTLGTGLKIAGAAAAAGLGVAGVAAIKFIGLGADLVESQNKVNVVFGDSAKQISDFADNSARSFGIAKVDALSYAGTLGTILKGSGLTEEATADMSEDLVKLAADMASFNNIPIDQALEKIRAGLVGESEPLRTVGVLLSEAAVKTKAYQMGLAAEGDELTDAQKVQARYALILEQTTDQQGDFARTSDSLANRQRILQARFKDLQSEIGQKLLPVAVKLSGWALELFDILDMKVIPVIETLASVFGATLTGDAARANAAIGNLPPSLQGVGDAVASVARWIRDDLTPALQAIGQFIIEHVIPNFLLGVETLQDFYNLAIKPVVDFILNNKVALIAAITAVGVAILIALGPGAVAVAAILGFITLLGLLRDNWGSIKDFFNDTLGEITGFFRDNWQEILGIVLTIFTGPGGLIYLVTTNSFGIRDAMIGAFEEVMAFLAGLPARALELGKGFINALGDGVRFAINSGLIPALEGGINAIIDIINKAADAANSLDLFGVIPDIPTLGHVTLPRVGGGASGAEGGGAIPRGIQMARGGIVTRPTLALIGEAGPEAVVPLKAASGGIVINFTYAPQMAFASPSEMERAAITLKSLLRNAI